MSNKQQTHYSDITDYYYKKHGKPESSGDALNKLYDVYIELFKLDRLDSDTKEGIAEYHRILSARGLPAYEWILEAIHVTSKKDSTKRNFGYIVGMLRQWMVNGFGYIPTTEENEVIDYFEEILGDKVSLQARQVIQRLMGEHGAVKLARKIGSIQNQGADYLLATHLEHLLEVE